MYPTLILSCRPRLFLPAVHDSDTFTDTSPTSITSRKSSSSSRARRDDPHVGLPTNAPLSRTATLQGRLGDPSSLDLNQNLQVPPLRSQLYHRLLPTGTAHFTLRHVCSCSSMMMTYSSTYRNNLWITTITVLYATPFQLMLCPGRITFACDCEGECLAPTR